MLSQRKVEGDMRLKDVAAALQRRSETRTNPDDDDGVAVERTGCFRHFACFKVGRTRVRTVEVTAGQTTQAEAHSSSHAQAGAGGLLSKFMSGHNAHRAATARLDGAATLLAERLESLDQRVQSAREEAKMRMQAGQKSNAMRALKRAKMLELSLAQASTALSALDRQRELFEEAELNKQVTGAISDTMKKMKKTCKTTNLSSAERAIDDAQDVQDGLTDLNDVMAQFSASGLSAAGVDDEDALMDELNAMVEGQAADELSEALPAPVATAAATAAPVAKRLPSVPFPSVPSDESGTTTTAAALAAS